MSSINAAASTSLSDDDKKIHAWRAAQFFRRRLWRGSATKFKEYIDWWLWDEHGNTSSLIAMSARDGRKRWQWSSRWFKGSIQIEMPEESSSHPTANIFVEGNEEQIENFIDIIKTFTEEWCGEIPKMKASARKSLRLSADVDSPWRRRSCFELQAHTVG